MYARLRLTQYIYVGIESALRNPDDDDDEDDDDSRVLYYLALRHLAASP